VTHPGSSYRILVTAGPTIEPIDPVRFISNRSTGLMGYEVARAAVEEGFSVCLVTGPACLDAPEGVELVRVSTTEDMRKAVMERLGETDCLVMAAAVCDFRPLKTGKEKIKKTDSITLELVKNPDILKEAGTRKGLMKVGFALETEDLAANAEKKLADKELDMIVANAKIGEGDPFGGGIKDFILMDKGRRITELKGVTKTQCAEAIIREVKRLLG